MKLSTKGRYGVRFMLDLALHQKTGLMTLKAVAARQNISEKYLWQVIHPLKAAGLIRVARGARGGFALTRPPSNITVWDVVSTLEGEDLVTDCARRPACCKQNGECVVRHLWAELQSRMAQWMKAVTLEQLAERQRAEERHAMDFAI